MPAGPARLAVLREDELASDHPARADLAQLAVIGPDRDLFAVQAEAPHSVAQGGGGLRHHRPPVAGCAADGARLGHRITIAEHEVVHLQREFVADFTPWDRLQMRHRVSSQLAAPIGHTQSALDRVRS